MKTLILGMGNVLRGDDGVGSRVVAALTSRLAERADLRSVDGDLFTIGNALDRYGKLVVIDALPPGNSPGRLEVTVIAHQALPCRGAYSLHDMDLLWQLRMIAGSFRGEIMLIGIEAQSVGFSFTLSQELARQFPLLVEEAAQAIECFMALPSTP